MNNTLLEDRRFYVYVYVDLSLEILLKELPYETYYSFFIDNYPILIFGKPFYIGKGSGKRIESHIKNLNKEKNIYKLNYFNDLSNDDSLFHFYRLKDHMTQKEAYDLEHKLILHFGTIYDGTGILTNKTKRHGKIINCNRKSWNTGLTKETDERVAKAGKNISKKNKGKKAWNEGLTKETDERLKNIGKNISKSRERKPPWNKGLTKETDERVKKNAENISIALVGHIVSEESKDKMRKVKSKKENNYENCTRTTRKNK